MKKIVLTGGGTAGHVTPNIALIPELKKAGYEIYYIGSYDGIEKKLIEKLGIPYYGISSGKLRRYIDLKNFSDPFKVLKGLAQARHLLKKIKPDVVFSKDGFVSVPVVVAAKSRRIPCIIHESDMTPGLANKICIPCAVRVCTNFPETLKHLPAEKAVLTGSPIREELFKGSKEKGLEFCGFDDSKPVVLIIGGSLGAVAVNNAVRGIWKPVWSFHSVNSLYKRTAESISLAYKYDFVITFHIHLPHFRNCHTTNKIPVFIFGRILMSIHESNDDRLPLSFCSLSPLQVCHH